MTILDTTISRHAARGASVPGFLIVTKQGHRYFVTADDANIIRLDMPFEPSGQWRARCVYTSRGAYLSGWYDFAPRASSGGFPMLYKNGKPMYFLGDWDHGTARGWGDGMTSIRRAMFSRGTDGRWMEGRA